MVNAKLSRREREILDVLYALGDNATAEEIREKLSDPPSYSAARAMLAKLEAKGAIKHRAEGLRYVYSPVTSRSSAQKKAVSNLMRVFFSGSASQAATALLKQESWSDDELAALRSEIEQVRKNRRK
jgi:BlaI family penicillinase repressor